MCFNMKKITKERTIKHWLYFKKHKNKRKCSGGIGKKRNQRKRIDLNKKNI